MGQATFNLSEFFNRLGIKNPRPTMLESVQPVTIVANLDELTPNLRAPSMMVGFDIAATVGERGLFQIFARGPGGTLVNSVTGSLVLFLVTDAADLSLTPQPTICTFGDDATRSVVTKGTSLVNPFSGTQARYASSTRANFPIANRPWYLAPNQILTVGVAGTNIAVQNNNVWLTDLPAASLGP